MHDESPPRAAPSPLGLIAGALVAVGILLWMFVSKGLLVLGGRGGLQWSTVVMTRALLVGPVIDRDRALGVPPLTVAGARPRVTPRTPSAAAALAV